MKILVVDDEQVFIDLVIETFPMYNVIGTRTPIAARLIILDFKPDIVIVDQNMASMKGSNLIRSIKKTHPNLIMILWSSDDNRRYAEGCRVDFASKDDIKDLRKVILSYEKEKQVS